MKLYRVYYEENIAYEDYIEAVNEEQAKAIFQANLESEDGYGYEPVDMNIVEFEADEMDDHTGTVKGNLPCGLF